MSGEEVDDFEKAILITFAQNGLVDSNLKVWRQFCFKTCYWAILTSSAARGGIVSIWKHTVQATLLYQT